MMNRKNANGRSVWYLIIHMTVTFCTLLAYFFVSSGEIWVCKIGKLSKQNLLKITWLLQYLFMPNTCTKLAIWNSCLFLVRHWFMLAKKRHLPANLTTDWASQKCLSMVSQWQVIIGYLTSPSAISVWSQSTENIWSFYFCL